MTKEGSNTGVSDGEELERDQRRKIETYMDYLLDYNRRINLVSRKMTRERLGTLIAESLCLSPLVSGSTILDAGSGNGLLGVPLAIVNPAKNVVLIESKAKKQAFLNQLRNHLGLRNLRVQESDVTRYLSSRPHHEGVVDMVARGFPHPELLVSYLNPGVVDHLLMITSRTKLTKIKKSLETVNQKIYNIPFRDNLIILHMENVSRETKREKV